MRKKDPKTALSRYISLLLRHHPEAAGLTLDRHGWVQVEELLAGVNRTRKLTREQLEDIVATDEKGRYAFNAEHTMIRANQGHSVAVDVELERCTPPETLYHGTAERFLPSILAQGLLPGNRLYVHLSGDADTAVKVGARHGRPVVLRIRAGDMDRDGLAFYRSANGVWLTERVPAAYLEQTGPQIPFQA